MKIYEVICEDCTRSNIVVAKNEEEALNIVFNYINRHPMIHWGCSEDFSVNVIDANNFSEPTIIV